MGGESKLRLGVCLGLEKLVYCCLSPLFSCGLSHTTHFGCGYCCCCCGPRAIELHHHTHMYTRFETSRPVTVIHTHIWQRGRRGSRHNSEVITSPYTTLSHTVWLKLLLQVTPISPPTTKFFSFYAQLIYYKKIRKYTYAI